MANYLTPREMAEKLKVKLSTIYKMSMDGRLPKVKIGGIVRFPEDKVEEMLEKNLIPVINKPKEFRGSKHR